MPQYLRLLLLSCVIFLLAGCSNPNLHPTTPGIQQANYDRTVAVVLVSDFGGADTHSAFCSATWVSKTTILTANHCVVGYATMKYKQKVYNTLIAAGFDSIEVQLFMGLDLDDVSPDDPDAPAEVKRMILLAKSVPPIQPLGLTIPFLTPQDVNEVGYPPYRLRTSVATVLNSRADLALLEVKIADVPAGHSFAQLAAQTPQVGANVHLRGNPHHLFFSYRQGFVSGYHRTFDRDQLKELDGPFMQISTGMSHGDSGSGVFDDQNHLVGLASFIEENANMGFCIHLETIRGFLAGQHLIDLDVDHHDKDPDLSGAALSTDNQ